MKPRVPRDQDGVRIYNPERTCLECKHNPCILGQDKCKADFAKYGCVMYDGKNC